MLEQTTTQFMTLDEFMAEYHKQPFELVNGEKKPIMPNVMVHQLMLRALFRILDAFCLAHKIGEVITELPFVEVYDSTWVKGSRTPDIMFFSAARWQKYVEETENWLKKPPVFAPDLAIEIVSPNDSYGEIQDKVEEYLAQDVRLIWMVDPQRKRITVYHGDQYQRLTAEHNLTGGDVMPGLEIKLSELFQ